MDIDMSIAALSVDMHQMKAQQDVGLSVMKMAMETVEMGAEELLEGMGGSLDPNLGTAVDVMA